MEDREREGKREIADQSRPLRLLSRTAAAAHRTTSATRLEVSTRRLAAHTATATRSTTTSKSPTVELPRVLTAFLDLHLDAIDRVRVSSDSGLESGGCLEVNKGAVLNAC